MSCQHIAINLSHSERVSITCLKHRHVVSLCLFTEGGVVAKVLLLIWLVFTLQYQGG